MWLLMMLRALCNPFSRLGFLWFLLLGTSVVSAAPTETAKDLSRSTTVIALKLESEEPIAVETKFQASTAVLTLLFPSKKIISSLPEQSVVGEGVIRSIAANYESSRGKLSLRYLKSLQIKLNGPYPYQVRSQAGHVLVEITHPTSVTSASVEVGVKGGTIVSGLARPRISDRFRAMQDALAQATPVPWGMELDLTPAHPSAAAAEIMPAPSTTVPESLLPASRIIARSAIRWWPLGLIGIFGLAMAIIVVAYYLLLYPASGKASSTGYLPSSTSLIDQLVWKAFERQGYQMMSETVFSSPVGGTFRTIQKEGAKSAFFVVGQGVFLEKRTVEQVVGLMHGANLDQGILVASGAFTVPAQRTAKMHRLTLIGREQLTELVGVGAAGEYVTRQLERQQLQLNEAMGTLEQYSKELEALRQQRNEATWLLGENRNRVASLETQFADVSEQLQRYHQELEHWQQEAVDLKKRWEESEWYLGESKARVDYLEQQVATLQSAMQRAEVAERERESLQVRYAELEQVLEATRRHERELEGSLEHLKEEVAQTKTYGERRSQPRVRVQEAFVELLNGTSDAMFSGTVRDLSESSIGLATDRELLDRIRFRLHIPGQAPFESKAKVIWQRPIDNTLGFVSGFRFLGLSEDACTLLKTVTAK